MDDKKNNSAVTIIIIIILLALAALIAYFVFGGSMGNDSSADRTTTTENEEIDDTSEEEIDVAGAYTGTYNKNSNMLEDAADAVTDNEEDRVTVELLLEEDGTATFVKSGDEDETITGNYTYHDKKIILTRTDATNDETEEAAKTTDDKDTTTDEDVTTDTTDSTDETHTDNGETYEFTVNDDGSLSYTEKDTSSDKVTLHKTDRNNLKHIK